MQILQTSSQNKHLDASFTACSFVNDFEVLLKLCSISGVLCKDSEKIILLFLSISSFEEIFFLSNVLID